MTTEMTNREAIAAQPARKRATSEKNERRVRVNERNFEPFAADHMWLGQ